MRDFDWNNAVDKKFEDTRRSILETLNKLVERVITEEVVSKRSSPVCHLMIRNFNTPDDSKHSVSEIGWSSVATPETGRDIIRAAFAAMGFLQNIKGEDLKDKLESLDGFYAGENQAYLDKDSNGKAISTLSYLMVLQDAFHYPNQLQELRRFFFQVLLGCIARWTSRFQQAKALLPTLLLATAHLSDELWQRG